MKLFLLTILFLVGQFCFGQITISSTDLATGGDTVRISFATDPAIDFASTGSAFNWDFSSLVPDSQQVRHFIPLNQAPGFVQFIYGPFAPAAYQASYYLDATDLPLDQITSFLPVSLENIYQFSKRSSSSLTQVGLAMTVSGTDIPFKSDTIEKKYAFPIQFLDSFQSRGYTLIDFNPVVDAKWKQYRTRTVEVDGYGSITTPFGTFDALRIKHKIVERDSLYYTFPLFGATWIPIPLADTYEYEWITNYQKEPILKIRTQSAFGNEVVTAIEYRDINRFLDASLEEETQSFAIYPNPASNFLQVTGSSYLNEVSILNTTGQLIRKTSVIEDVFSVSDLNSGCYILQLEDKKGNKFYHKFIKE